MGEVNDIRIHNVHVETIARVKQLAKEKNLSMNIFLRNLLDNLAGLDEFKKYEQGYTDLVKKNLVVIENCTEQLKRIANLISEVDE